MENIALVTIKFPQNHTTSQNSASEDCQVAPSPSKQDESTRCRPSTKNSPSVTKQDTASVQPGIGVKFISAGLAACYSDLMTFPLDTAKVRLQVLISLLH